MKKIFLYFAILALLPMLNTFGADVTVEVNPLPRDFPLNIESRISWTFSWTDADASRALLPPVLPEIEWGRLRVLSARIHKNGAQMKAVTVLGITPVQPGNHVLPGLTFQFFPLEEKDKGEQSVTELLPAASESVITEALDIHAGGKTPFLFPAGLGGSALYLACFLLYLRRRAKKRSSSAVAEPTLDERLSSLLHQARRLRLDGSYYECYRLLHSIALQCNDNGRTVPPALLSRLEKGMNDTGYRGKRPSGTDLEGDFKDVEQVCALSRAHETQGV